MKLLFKKQTPRATSVLESSTGENLDVAVFDSDNLINVAAKQGSFTLFFKDGNGHSDGVNSSNALKHARVTFSTNAGDEVRALYECLTAINNATNILTFDAEESKFNSTLITGLTSIIRYTDGVASTESILFTPITAPAHQEGLVFYDADSDTLVYYNAETDVLMNIGRENWIKVYNDTGSTITNGQAVYISGYDGTTDLPEVSLCDPSTVSGARFAGLATHDIENGTVGYITAFGRVNNLNTSSFTAGNPLFLDPSTPGALTETRPSSPTKEVLVGVTVNSNASTGSIFIGNIKDGELISSSEFADNVFRINDNSDSTKQLAFQISGVSTGTTRTITMPDSDVDLGSIGGGGKFVLPISFEVSPSGSTRFFAGTSTGGVNNTPWASFRDPWTAWNRGFDSITGGFIIPYNLSNVRFRLEFYINGGSPSGTLTARCFSLGAPSSGDAYTTTYTQTSLASGTVAVSATNTVYVAADTSSTNSFTAFDTIVFGIETTTFSSMSYRCKGVIYADFA